MKISVFIPAHNESKNLKKLIPKIHDTVKKISRDFEIIVVNDNSNDNSKEILAKLKAKYPVLKFINRNMYPGPGNAYRAGFKLVRGDIVVTMDGDLSHNPAEIPNFLKAIKDTDIVCGSRYIKGGYAHMNKSRTIISSLFNLFFRKLIGFKVKDFTSGFRAIRKEVTDNINLRSSGFGIYIEIPIKAFLKGFRIVEIPITYHKRQEGKSNLNYFKQGPDYLKVILNNFFEIMMSKIKKPRRKNKEVLEIYQSYSPEIDTMALNSRKRIQRKWHEEKMHSVLELGNLNRKKILDIGCGSGGITFRLAKKIKDSCFIGADFNKGAIEYANNRLKKEKSLKNRLKFRQGKIEDLPFRDNYFDVIIGLDVLDHSTDYKKALRELYRTLKPRGRVLLTVENRKSLWPLVEKLWDRLGDGRNYGETHLIHLNKKELFNITKSAGFRNTKIETIHNIRTFFYLFTNYFPEGFDRMMRKRCWGLTLLCKMRK